MVCVSIKTSLHSLRLSTMKLLFRHFLDSLRRHIKMISWPIPSTLFLVFSLFCTRSDAVNDDDPFVRRFCLLPYTLTARNRIKSIQYAVRRSVQKVMRVVYCLILFFLSRVFFLFSSVRSFFGWNFILKNIQLVRASTDQRDSVWMSVATTMRHTQKVILRQLLFIHHAHVILVMSWNIRNRTNETHYFILSADKLCFV